MYQEKTKTSAIKVGEHFKEKQNDLLDTMSQCKNPLTFREIASIIYEKDITETNRYFIQTHTETLRRVINPLIEEGIMIENIGRIKSIEKSKSGQGKTIKYRNVYLFKLSSKFEACCMQVLETIQKLVDEGIIYQT